MSSKYKSTPADFWLDCLVLLVLICFIYFHINCNVTLVDCHPIFFFCFKIFTMHSLKVFLTSEYSISTTISSTFNIYRFSVSFKNLIILSCFFKLYSPLEDLCLSLLSFKKLYAKIYPSTRQM